MHNQSVQDVEMTRYRENSAQIITCFKNHFYQQNKKLNIKPVKTACELDKM